MTLLPERLTTIRLLEAGQIMAENQNSIIRTSIIRTEENGIEYYTVAATGKSGMSQRGLARACGVDEKSIRVLAKELRNKPLSKPLEPFVGKDLKLTKNLIVTGKQGKPAIGKPAIVYKASFCSAVIKHYAYKGSEKAQEIDLLTGKIGLSHFIQTKTEWTPTQSAAAPQAQDRISRILDAP